MTYRTEIENLLTDIRNHIHKLDSMDESTLPELDNAVRKTMAGFIDLIQAIQLVRTTQKAYFKAKRAGSSYDASKLLDDSKKAEKILDDLVIFWAKEMAPPSAQARLF